MIVSNINEFEPQAIQSPGAENAYKRICVGPAEGWEGYVMRVINLGRNGYSPAHSHPWPHINYILRGKGLIKIDGTEYEVEEGSYAYVPEGVDHQFCNYNSDFFQFVCIVPERGEEGLK